MDINYCSFSCTTNFELKTKEKYTSVNAVNYLRNFILKELFLSDEEREILNNIRHIIPQKEISKKYLRKIGKRKCKVCDEIKDVSKFYHHMQTCKVCYNAERKKKRMEKNEN